MKRELKADRILIIRTDRIGDVLISTPVIKVLRDTYPRSFIAMMVRPYAKDIVDGNPFLDEIIIYDKYGRHKSVLSNLKFAFDLKKKKFDLAVILHPTNRVHLLSWLAGIPMRVGFDRKLPFLLNRAVSDRKHKGVMHEVDYCFELLKKIGIDSKEKNLFMPVTEQSMVWAEALFRDKKIDKDRPVFCLHPGASCISKKWPAENFARLSDLLSEELKAQIIIFVGKGDEETADKVYELSANKPLCVLKSMPLGKIAALLKKSNLLISNDSGPVHMSVGVGTKVVAIFGRSQAGLSPKRWGPLGEKDIVLHKNVGCEVCLAHNCRRDFACLKAVKVEDVLDAVRRVI